MNSEKRKQKAASNSVLVRAPPPPHPHFCDSQTALPFLFDIAEGTTEKDFKPTSSLDLPWPSMK